MSAKSTFMVLDIKSLNKHIPKVWDKHYFLIQKLIRIGEN